MIAIEAFAAEGLGLAGVQGAEGHGATTADADETANRSGLWS